MTVQETAALLRQKDNILILTHRRPDGDTIGCAAGLCAALRQLGKTAFLHPNPDVTEINAVYAQPYWAPADFAPDFVVSVDIAARQLFHPAMEGYLDRVDLAIDHHPSQEFFARETCLEADKAACGEIIFAICRLLGPVTEEIALPLYAAVATDTGCFSYANTTPNTHTVAAELMACGINAAAVNKRHFRTKSRVRMRLEGELLANMAFFDRDRGAILAIPLSLVEKLGATENDLDDVSALATLAEGVDCGAVLRELSPGEWKLSLRTGENGRVNASRACGLLGGGGHAMAAGATLLGNLDQVKAQVLQAIAQVAGT